MGAMRHRATLAADRLRAALDGAPDPELEPLLGLEPPPEWAGVPGDLARGAALLADVRPTAAGIRAAVAPEAGRSTVGRWLDPSHPGSPMPWSVWCALLTRARAALAAETASAA